MGWAVTLEGRTDPGAVMLLFDDRTEAESLAGEIRARGTQVVVRFYPPRGAGVASAPAAHRPD
jgi:hypothetical protein